MEEKLTYRQICVFAAAGQYGLIPDGYKVRWANGIAPGRVVDLNIDGNKLTFTRNNFPHPDIVRISGDRCVVVPPPSYDNNEKLVEFGEVYIYVEFAITHIEFVYCIERLAVETNKRINEYADIATTRGFISKKDFVFDVSVDVDNGKLSIHDMMFSNISYPPLTYKEIDDSELMTVEFNYDWWNFVPNVDRVGANV